MKIDQCVSVRLLLCATLSTIYRVVFKRTKCDREVARNTLKIILRIRTLCFRGASNIAWETNRIFIDLLNGKERRIDRRVRFRQKFVENFTVFFAELIEKDLRCGKNNFQPGSKDDKSEHLRGRP